MYSHEFAVDLRTWIGRSREKVYHNRLDDDSLPRHVPIAYAMEKAADWRLAGRRLHAAIDDYDAFLVKNPDYPIEEDAGMMLAFLMANVWRLDHDWVHYWLQPLFCLRDDVVRALCEKWEFEEQLAIADCGPKPNLWDYVDRIGTAAGNGPKTQKLAQYFAELVQINGGIDRCTLGKIACLCVLIARLHISEDRDGNGNAWPLEMVDRTGLGLGDFEPHLDEFCRLLRPYRKKNSLHIAAIVHKYHEATRLCVGEIPLLSPEDVKFAIDRERAKNETLQEKCRQIIRRNVSGDVHRLPLPSCLIRMLE